MNDNLHKEAIIKNTNIKGTIIDIFENKNIIYYVIELDDTFEIEIYKSDDIEVV